MEGKREVERGPNKKKKGRGRERRKRSKEGRKEERKRKEEEGKGKEQRKGKGNLKSENIGKRGQVSSLNGREGSRSKKSFELKDIFSLFVKRKGSLRIRGEINEGIDKRKGRRYSLLVSSAGFHGKGRIGEVIVSGW